MLATGHVAVIRKGPAPDRQEFREIGPSRRWFKVSGIPEPTWRPPMENSAAPPAQGRGRGDFIGGPDMETAVRTTGFLTAERNSGATERRAAG